MSDQSKSLKKDAEVQSGKTENGEEKVLEAQGSEEKINDLIHENAHLKDKFVRLSADFQNYRRMVEKQRESLLMEAQIAAIKPFLEFLDELKMALRSGKDFEDEKFTSWFSGFEIMQKTLNKKLEELGVREIDCGLGFDPNYHEALMHVDSKDHQEGDIVEVLSSGYTFKGRVVRPAKVSIAR